MSEAQHTPGLVILHKCRCGHPSCSQYRLSTQGTVGFEIGDAQLYAAAPELLDAMEDVLPTLIGLHIATERQSASAEDAIAKMSAAIAKAKGGVE